MDGLSQDLSKHQSLPFRETGGRERRIGAAFCRHNGETLAVQVQCTLDGAPTVSVLVNRLAAGATLWPAPVAVAVELPVPDALSQLVAPAMIRDEASNFVVAWPFEQNGCLLITAKDATVALGRGDAACTAICGENGQVCLATEPDLLTGEVEIRLRSAAGDWQSVGAKGLLCSEIELVTSLALFDGHVYAAKANQKTGFEVWRAPVKSAGTAVWDLVIPSGGWRYASSPYVSAMAVIGKQLFLAAVGPDRSFLSVGDEYPEVLAVNSDASWSLFSGVARFSPNGLLQTATAGGPGSAAFTGMAVGGFVECTGGLRAWLKPLDSGQDSIAILTWTRATGAWTTTQTIRIDALDVFNVAVPAVGPAMIGLGTEVEVQASGHTAVLIAAP